MWRRRGHLNTTEQQARATMRDNLQLSDCDVYLPMQFALHGGVTQAASLTSSSTITATVSTASNQPSAGTSNMLSTNSNQFPTTLLITANIQLPASG